MIAFHQLGMACFKYFYLELMRNYRNLFSYLVYYDRFVALIKLAFPALVCLLKTIEGVVTEYLFIDATPMAVCHNLRERRHKVFGKKLTYQERRLKIELILWWSKKMC